MGELPEGGASPEDPSAAAKAIVTTLGRFLSPNDDVQSYLSETILPVLTPSLERLLRAASAAEALQDDGDEDEHHSHHRTSKKKGEGEGRKKGGDVKRRVSKEHRKEGKEGESGEFNALLWLSDHLRQFASPPGFSKYRERFDLRRANTREALNAAQGQSTLDMLDKPPSMQEQCEEAKTDAEVEEAVQLLHAIPGPLFSSLSPGALEKVVGAVSFADFEDGAVISEQGAQPTHAFIVASGEVESDVKGGVNGEDDDDITNGLLKRAYARGAWWPAECIYDCPLHATTKAVGPVRVGRIPVDFFRALVLPASMQARQILFSQVYSCPVLRALPRYARALLGLECLHHISAAEEAEVNLDSSALVLCVEGAVMNGHDEVVKAPEVLGKVSEADYIGIMRAAPACKCYVANREQLTRVFNTGLGNDVQGRLSALP